MREINTRVKRTIWLLIFIATFSFSWAQTPIWEENFDGTTINKDVWTYDVSGDGMGNGELQYYTDRAANSYISGGNLVIEAKREAYEGRQFTSARLKTLGRFSFKYGIIEARIKLPDLKEGLWPAFWTMGDNIGQQGWPKCGEIDILEAGSEAARLAGKTNSEMSGALHWWHETGTWSTWLQADASASTTLPSGNFYDAYHTYKMVWDSTHIEIWLDNNKFFDMNISAPELSEFRQPHFILLNLAVGGRNYVNLTDPAQITAPLPGKMLVDYVRIYPIAGQTQIYKATDDVKSGKYGVFTDNTVVNDRLNLATDADIYLWNNMTTGTGASYEGANVWNYNIGAANWWGMGVMARRIKNMSKFSDGYLHFYMKTSSTETIGIGVGSASGEGWVELVNGSEQYGLVRDGQWHEVKIPLNRYAVDFNSIYHLIMIKGAAPASAFSFSVDDIYWMEGSPRLAPENGNFGVYTDNTACVLKFNTPADGNFYVWDKTLNATTTTPKEGSNVLSFTSAPGLTWFGAAFTPNAKYNLTAFRYATSKLHFDIKTSSTATFKIGIKSSNTPNIGQAWITFKNGADPYGFIRNGQWQSIEIPMSAFDNVDLSQVSQLFELLGTEGAISDIAIDNIYYTGGGTAIKDGTTTVSVTGVTVNPTSASIAVGATTQLTATVAPSNATNKTVTWSSSNTAIATVSSTGLVTGVAAGSATITVTTQDGAKTANCAVTVTIPNVPVSGVTVAPATASIVAGSTTQLTATVAPSNATNKSVTWSSSNTSVATVSSTGLVTAVAAGSATITVRTNDGAKTATCAVTVTPNNGTNIALNKPVTASSVENAGTPGSAAVDNNATTRWSSAFSDPQSITIDLQGTYNITKIVLNWEAAAGKTYQVQVSSDNANWTNLYSTTTGAGGIVTQNVSGTGRYIRMYGTVRTTPYGYSLYEFEVYGTPSNNVAVTGVTVSPTSATVAINATTQLTATVAPSNATNKTVTWTSSNTAVATVSSTGLVTGKAAGTATITATTQDGAKTATCAITVPTANVPVTGVGVAPSSVTLTVNATQQLTATVSPSNATNKTVTWSSSNTNVATVSSTGLVTAKALGSATITATTQDGGRTANCSVSVISSATNIALNKPVTVFSTENAGTPGSYAVDGNASTRWSSAHSDPQWIVVDLQGTYNINKVVLNWETAAGKSYQVQVSNDNVNWTNMYTTTTGAAGVATLNVTGTGRYVRVYGTVRTTAWGYSLWELEVYGTSTTTPCTVANSSGDYSVNVSADASNPTITFVPARTGVGSTTCILYYGTSATGTLAGYSVTANTAYRITASAGQVIYFYYTYSVPEGGEKNTATNRNSFTVGSCSTLKSAVVATNVQELTEGDFVAYPVPMKDELNLQFEADMYKRIAIVDISGKVVYSGGIEQGATHMSLDVSKLQKGTFYIKLVGDNANAGKLVIK